MDTKILIGKFVTELPRRRIFVTRELLTFGLRSTVDCVTSAMVGKGILIRLANGVFVRNDPGMKMPSLEEIVEAKARAFAKKANPLDRHLATEFKINPKARRHAVNKKKERSALKREPIVAIFAVLGCTSSFRTIHGRVEFRHTPGRKYFLSQGEATKKLVAWWAGVLGENFENMVEAHLCSLGKKEKKRFKEVGAWAPAWISDFLVDDPPRFSTQALYTIYPHSSAVDLGSPPPGPRVAESISFYRLAS
ncbi:MAG: hypothetical protein IT342_06455 [Candidatus Melainabacteria bacterium]|nr:hypothetical protein [Candidatus Melainabacteria bacterium]